MTQYLGGQGTNAIVLTLDEVGTGVDTTQISLPLGNLWLTGGYPNAPQRQGMAVWVHQQAPDTNAPTVTFHIPQPNRSNYPRFAPLSFLLHEHPRNGGMRNGIDFSVRAVGADGVALGTPVPGFLIHDFSGVLTFTPDGGLAPDTTYQVDFHSNLSDPLHPVGFQDAAGNVMAPYSFRFSTGGGVNALPPPVFASVTASDWQPLPGEEFEVSASATGSGVVEYRFNFDGVWSAWAPHGVTNHSHAVAGRHRVLVQARDASGLVATAPLNLLVTTPAPGPAPTQSSTLAIGEDPGVGRRVWVVNPDADTVTVLDATTRTVVAEHAVGRNPRSITRDALGRYWVTCMGSDEIRVLNPDGSLARGLSLPYGSAPFGIVASPDGQAVYVSLYGSARLRRYAATDPLLAMVEVGTPFPTPRAMAVSGNGERVLVTRFLSAEREGEVGEFAGLTLAHVQTLRLASASTVDGGDRAAGVPNHLAGIAIAPDGRRAVVVSKQDNVFRGTFYGVGNLTHETTVRAVLSVLDLEANLEVRHARRDFDNSDSPTAVVYTPAGDTLLVTLQGNNRVVGLDALALDPVTGPNAQGATQTSPVVKTLEAATGLAPQGLLLDSVGRRVFVQDFLGRTATILDAGPLLMENRTSLGTLASPATVGAESLAPAVLTGKRIFYNAADPRMSADGYLSCASCHVDGGSDGRVWDFTGRGEGLRRTTDLRGRAGTGHGNVHWTGNFDEIQDFEHDMRGAFGGSGFLPDAPAAFATNHPSPATVKAGLNTELDSLAAYVASLDNSTIPRSPHRATDGQLTQAGELGRAVYLGLNCQQCHGGERLTDSLTAPIGAVALHDVGTLSRLSGQRLGATLTGVDTPTLRGLHATGRYLHHGQATTLSEAFVQAGGNLHLASEGELLGAAGVGIQVDLPAQGGGGELRGAWGGTLVSVFDVPGNGVRFGGVEGGSGGPARIGLRHILRGQGSAVLRVNGVEQAIGFLTQEPNNDWMTSGWRWVSADVVLGPGPTNVVEVVRGAGAFANFQLNAILVSHAGILASAAPHRVVTDLQPEAQSNLVTFLRSLDGTAVSLAPVVPLTAVLGPAPGGVMPFATGTFDFVMTFSRAVEGLEVADVVVGGTAGGTVETVTPIVPGLSYRIRVSGVTAAGTLNVQVDAGTVAAVDDGAPFAGALSPDVVHVASAFRPGPAYLWSFNAAVGAAPAGTLFPDTVQGESLEVRGLGAELSGGRIVLPGSTDSGQPDGTISAYMNLANGLISARTNLTVEIWAAPLSGRNWGSLFEFGRMDVAGDGLGEPGEWTGLGNTGPVGSQGLDLLALTTSRGTDLSLQRQVLMIGGGFQSDIQSELPTVAGQVHHYVLIVEAQGSGSLVRWYRDGVLVGTGNAPFLLTALQDVNNWFGRSHWASLSTAHTAYDEIRLHDRVLTAEQVIDSLGAGPDALLGNQPPQASGDTVVRGSGRSLKIPLGTLLANDADDGVPGALTVAAISPTSGRGVPLTIQAGCVLYAPGPGIGEDWFQYLVTDGDQLAQATVVIQIDGGSVGNTLNLVSTQVVGGSRHFLAAGIPGRSYRLQRASAVNGPWDDVEGGSSVGTAAANGTIQLQHALVVEEPVTFYRVVESGAQ
jgi:YVTN family beta-propeller protein